MCDKESETMGSLVNGSDVFVDNNEENSMSGASNRTQNTNFGPNFRVLKRTDQVKVDSYILNLTKAVSWPFSTTAVEMKRHYIT
jgi:hypothetical protein